eukprot:6488619-Amphidinium_carterae.2
MQLASSQPAANQDCRNRGLEHDIGHTPLLKLSEYQLCNFDEKCNFNERPTFHGSSVHNLEKGCKRKATR